MTNAVRQASKALFAALDFVAQPLQGPRILIYHQIGGGSGLEMEVDPAVFEWQLDWIQQHFQVVGLDSALEHPDRDSVVITFDDGYRSVYDVAFPLLRQREMPFTLYLTTQPIESGRPMRDHAGAAPLDWTMVKAMQSSGLLTLGAHTHTHPDLRWIEQQALAEELATCDGLIQERTGSTPRHFAYPWGYWSGKAHPSVSSRYETSALGSPGPRRRSVEAGLLHRLPVQRSDARRWFGSRVARGLLYEETVRRGLHGYRGPEVRNWELSLDAPL